MTPMRCLALLVLLLGGCTKANPKSCADGICNDQSLPFCDVDGTLGGEPNECIGVECTPGEVAACRGNVAVTCNQVGTNYDLVSCENRCEQASGGCVECTTDTECSMSEPICDARQCRGCEDDSECPSGVCNLSTGTCVAPTNVVYVIQDGTGPSPCTQVAPCDWTRGLSTAVSTTPSHPIRLLPGVHTSPLMVNGTVKLLVVGSGATLRSDQQLVDIESGADVEIRGVIFNGKYPGGGIGCGFQGSQASKLTLFRVTQLPEFGDIFGARCALTIKESELHAAAINEPIVRASGNADGSGTSLEIDRTRIIGDYGGNFVQASGLNVKVKITNSVLDRVGLRLNGTDPSTGSTQSDFKVGFSTLLDSGFDCTNAANTRFSVLAENNIVLSRSGSPSVTTPNQVCTFANNIFFPAAALGGTNRDVDPKLVDEQSDFTPRSDSPAVDTAAPTASLPASADLLGVSRPQGSKPDVGAYELKQ